MILAIAHPSPFLSRSDVDVCELNHFYDSPGQLRFSQIILWRWHRHTDPPGHQVTEYFIVDNGDDVMIKPSKKPCRTSVTWRSRHGHVYEVDAVTWIETHTTYDPEVLNRNRLPMDRRTPYFGGD